MVSTVHALQGDTLDAICWRHYGRTAGVVEQVLEANPELSSHGPIIPHGTAVQLPDITTQQQRQTVQLWD